MIEEDFEGTIILERLAEIGKVDEFFEAVDADDFLKAEELMNEAGVDRKAIRLVLEKMMEGE